jgi:hypothetical protein
MKRTLALLPLLAACGTTAAAQPSSPNATLDPAPPAPLAAPSLLEHDGALQCGSLSTASGALADVCAPHAQTTVSLTVESQPIEASRWAVLAALLDPDRFGSLPRPMPPGFEAPPIPHSVRNAASAGSPFVDHYVLFWGLLKASTVQLSVDADSIELVQLWRIDNVWSERDIRDGHPDISDDDLAARVGTPIMPEGMYSIVTFELRSDGPHTRVTMTQKGSPAFNEPVFAVHWQGLYFMPLKQGLEANTDSE